jgi:hypothetical protein
MIIALEEESARQAIRAGCELVNTSHVLLAIFSLHGQIAQVETSFPFMDMSAHGAAQMMSDAGVRLPELLRGAGTSRVVRAEVRPATVLRPRFVDGAEDPVWSAEAMAVMEHAQTSAESPSRAGTSNVLLGMFAGGTTAAVVLLNQIGVEVSSLERVLRDGPIK